MTNIDSSYATDDYVRLGAQRALWGQVPPSLRAVSMEIDRNRSTIYVRCIFDGEPSEYDRELLSVAATEVIADYSEPFTIEDEYIDITCPNPMSHLRLLIYLRHEVTTQS